MPSSDHDTIYALATPPGRSGVAVIRVSGPGVLASIQKITGLSDPKPRHAHYCVLSDPVSRETLDQGLLLYFKNPASFTGEDVAEYHLHGGHAVIQSMLLTLAGFEDHRMAEPGEFTRRAFENGKLDLTEAEAIADLIDAETAIQKSQALDQLGGALSKLYDGWAHNLIRSLAHLEADIDFPDEDLPDGVASQVFPEIKAIHDQIADHLNDNRKGERLRDGIQVVILGPPNAGKSTLINALVQRDIAIVSDIAGTTRDVIETHMDFGGYPVVLSDTAGLRPEDLGQSDHDRIESEGIRRAVKKAQTADLRILLFDGTSDQAPDKHTLSLVDDRSLVVVNKSDQSIKGQFDALTAEGLVPLSLSAETGQGLGQLIDLIVERIKDLIGSRETPSLTRERHRQALKECQFNLDRALNADMPELIAEDVRLSVRALGRITGRVDVEDLLDVIFKDFCIGK